jgi:hypothetical protein
MASDVDFLTENYKCPATHDGRARYCEPDLGLIGRLAKEKG